MFAISTNPRLLSTIAVAVFLLIGCKGSGSSSTSNIPQTLTNWTWKADSNIANSLGYSTTEGTATSTGQPSGRSSAMTWLDASGQFWVFSGAGGANDLWKFNTSTLQWTWISGNPGSTTMSAGVYGTQNAAATTNIPGQRSGGSTWVDAAGNLWLFGGYGIDGNGLIGYLNDEWMFTPSSNEWTWVGGSVGAGGSAAYSYGSQGVAAASNQPSPRSNAAQWNSTSTGVFYLFGGQSYTSGTTAVQNDLWSFNPTTKNWTWVSGPQTLNQVGSYGTLGAASASNQPGARQAATTWTDAAGNFWMFGGTGIDAVGGNGQLNDLWEYNTTSNQWIWQNGANTVNGLGVYGTNAVAAKTNQPGARSGAVGWTDGSGNMWLFGGTGINSSGTLVTLNDLWEYVIASGQWVWVNGSYNGNVGGSYGTLGVLSASNDPGARTGASQFKDASGNFWLFAGQGYDAASANGRLADLWTFVP